MKHLRPRPGSPNLYVRIPVPRPLQERLGQEEIWRSTGTSDEKTAELVAMKIISEKRELFDREMAELDSVIPVDPDAKVVELYHQKFLEELRARMRKHSKSKDAYDDWCKKMRREREEFVRLANVENYDRIRAIAEKFVKEHAPSIRTTGSGFDNLLAKMMIAIVDAFDVLLRQISGELDAEPASKFVRETLAAGNDSPSSGERLDELSEMYATEEIEEKGRKIGNIDQMRNSILLFIEWVGRDKNVRHLTTKDASGFRDVLSHFPAGRGRGKKLKTSSIPKCIAIAETDGLKLLSARTKNRYLADLSGFFRWLKKRGYVDKNIWHGMSFDTSRETNTYPPYSKEHLNKILSSPLFCGFLRDGKEHLAGDCMADDWRYWIPLICMFTGARATEIAQLHVDDLDEREGFMIGYIRADTKRGQSTKTKNSERLIVFHPILLRAGLKRYWFNQSERAKRDGNLQLFPELTAYEKRSELGRKPARWWGKYLKKIGVTDGGEGFGLHSFRHRLADEMREAGYLNEEFGQLVMGHSDRSMTARYGKVPQGTVQRLADMIAKAEFKGVDFSSILPKGGEQTGSKIYPEESPNQ